MPYHRQHAQRFFHPFSMERRRDARRKKRKNPKSSSAGASHRPRVDLPCPSQTLKRSVSLPISRAPRSARRPLSRGLSQRQRPQRRQQRPDSLLLLLRLMCRPSGRPRPRVWQHRRRPSTSLACKRLRRWFSRVRRRSPKSKARPREHAPWRRPLARDTPRASVRMALGPWSACRISAGSRRLCA